ncbi:uncharacterized protein LOC132273935 isoform X2 [Cornus florida]|nr:uncharacterized protein LOC132273935 isoform X2 [Cornus florida]
MEMLIKNAFLSATRDDPAIAKANKEIIMLQAEVDALTTKLETVTTKLDELMEKRVQHISDYEVGVMEVEIKIASTSAIARAEEEIIVLQAEVDAVTAKLQTVTTKLDEHKERREQHIGIPSLGTNSSSAVLDDFDEVVEEDSNAESEEDHESDTTLAELNKEIEAITAKLEALKKTRARHVSGLKLK